MVRLKQQVQHNNKRTFVPSSRLPFSSVKLSYAAASSLSFWSRVTPDWLFAFACVNSVCAVCHHKDTHTDTETMVLSQTSNITAMCMHIPSIHTTCSLHVQIATQSQQPLDTMYHTVTTAVN